MKVISPVLVSLFFLLLGVLAYSNTFHAPFTFDDRTWIEENVHIRMTDLSAEEITDVFKGRSRARPVPMLSFALNYHFGRYDVLGYHLVNILVHAINAILLYLFLRITLGLSPTPLPHASWVAFFSALLWLVHPVQTQSVTYIVQRMNSMAALFYVLSLLLYGKGRIVQRQGAGTLQHPKGNTRRPRAIPAHFFWFAGSGLAGLLAVGSKEISLTLPFFIFLYEWYFFQELSWTRLRRWFPWILCACVPVAGLAIVHFGPDPLEDFLRRYDFWDFTLFQRVLTEPRVVLYYVGLLFYPHPSRLNLDYDFPLSRSLFDPPTTFIAISLIAGFMGLALWLAKRERLLSFCILWFFGNLVIESSFIPLDLVFEHRLYLPSMLVSLALVGGAYRSIRPRGFATGLLCVAAVVLSVWTVQRNEVWRDAVSLWADTVKKSGNKARPHNNLGEALATEGKLEEAISHYQLALQIESDYWTAHRNLGGALLQQGRIQEAIPHLFYRPEHDKLRLFSEARFAASHNDLGNALLKEGRIEEAMDHYRQALRIKPDFAKAHYNLGNALAREGKIEEALGHYHQALRIKPAYADAHNNLGVALAGQGRLEEAIVHYRQALRINPDLTDAHNNLGNALLRQGRSGEAIAHYEEALRIDPDYANAHNNLGNAFARQGKFEPAISHYREALRIEPDFTTAHNNLGNALLRQGRSEEAMFHLHMGSKGGGPRATGRSTPRETRPSHGP